MFLSAPRGFRDPAAILERRLLLNSVPAIQPLRAWTAGVVERRIAKQPDILIPDFDPAEAGIDSRILFVFEAPGPKTVPEWGGSGFICVDNDDETAANLWKVRDRVGLHEKVTATNIVPWVLGRAGRKPSPDEARQGGMELRRLLPLLPDLRVVVLAGLHAQKGWRDYVAPHLDDEPRTISTWHPSGQSFAQPGKRDEFVRALERAVSIAR